MHDGYCMVVKVKDRYSYMACVCVVVFQLYEWEVTTITVSSSIRPGKVDIIRASPKMHAGRRSFFIFSFGPVHVATETII